MVSVERYRCGAGWINLVVRTMRHGMARVLGVAGIMLGVCLVSACDDSLQNPRVPDEEKAAPTTPKSPSFSMSAIQPPDICTFTLTMDSETGAMPLTNSGCNVPDSAYVRVTVRGSVIVTANPGFTCCADANALANPAHSAAHGTWGPTGIRSQPYINSGAQVYTEFHHNNGGGATNGWNGYPVLPGNTIDSVVYGAAGYTNRGGFPRCGCGAAQVTPAIRAHQTWEVPA